MTTRDRRFLIVGVATALLAGGGAMLARVWIQSSEDQPYSRIEEGLYLGGSVAQPPRGTRAVVNLCGRPDSYQVGPVLWEPIYEVGADDARPKLTLDLLCRVVGFIVEHRLAGHTVYVHCMVGQNRSVAAVAAYLMQQRRIGRDEALSVLQRERPIVRLDPTLMTLLSDWEHSLQRFR